MIGPRIGSRASAHRGAARHEADDRHFYLVPLGVLSAQAQERLGVWMQRINAEPLEGGVFALLVPASESSARLLRGTVLTIVDSERNLGSADFRVLLLGPDGYEVLGDPEPADEPS